MFYLWVYIDGSGDRDMIWKRVYLFWEFYCLYLKDIIYCLGYGFMLKGCSGLLWMLNWVFLFIEYNLVELVRLKEILMDRCLLVVLFYMFDVDFLFIRFLVFYEIMSY